MTWCAAPARRMLQAALEREADDYVKAHAHLRNEHGHRIVKRNGHHPGREILTGAGPLAIQRPHIRDPRAGHTFTSAILPRYMRRSPSLADRRSADALIPALYLRGVSTNDFALALEAILGPQAGKLSPSSISRLKGAWLEEYRQWNNRDPAGKRYVYLWADGLYFHVRMGNERPCMLVIIGACARWKERTRRTSGRRAGKQAVLEGVIAGYQTTRLGRSA